MSKLELIFPMNPELLLKEIRWFTERKLWHPGTIVKHIKELLDKQGVTSEIIFDSKEIEE